MHQKGGKSKKEDRFVRQRISDWIDLVRNLKEFQAVVSITERTKYVRTSYCTLYSTVPVYLYVGVQWQARGVTRYTVYTARIVYVLYIQYTVSTTEPCRSILYTE